VPLHACVASPHHLASEAGADVLRNGGNAVDAIVAANLVLGVVTPYYCGPGGDLFAQVWDGAPHAVHSNGAAPAGATPESIRAACDAGHGDPDESFPWTGGMPIFGALPVTVPGAVAGWFALLDRWGTMSFGEAAGAALRHAEDGIEVSDVAAGFFERAAGRYARDPAWSQVYGAKRPGERWEQPAHARLLRALADGGSDAFYRGEVADAIVAALRQRGSSMTADDLAAHRVVDREALRVGFRGLEVLELPPPTQGATACQLLATADRFDAGLDLPLRTHLHVEAARAAMADRDRYLGAPDAMTVDPEDLFARSRIDAILATIDPERATDWPVPTPMPGGTAYLCAADADGLMVSLIQSNYVGFGSGVVVPEYGFGLQNRGAHFTLDADSPNVIAPRKQPTHTLIPGLALRDGRPRYVFGTMGGDGQPQIHLQVLTGLIDDGMAPQEAVSAARWIVDVADGGVRVELRTPDDVVAGLRAAGHAVTVVGGYEHGMGHAHVIEVLADGRYEAGSDPRAEGSVAGV
jgi:gamma-glutamyltranspeptidase/glutathione hydrolase